METQKVSKIGFIIPTLGSGGAERVVSILANKLVEDFDVFIIVFYKCDFFYRIDDRVTIEFCKEQPIARSGHLVSLINHLKLFSKVKHHIKKNKIDVAIGFMTTANIYTVVASKLLRIPSIISERVHPDHSAISSFWFKIRRMIYPKASKIVVQTQPILHYFEAFVNRDKLSIINNPIAPELMAQRDLEVKKESIILNVGRLDHQKNQDLLIKAFSNINNEGWKLILIGEGSNRNKYEALVSELNLSHKVFLPGTVSDVHTYYNKARIFVFTSIFEGSPNALIEALCFGLPCISTDCPTGPSDLITDGENGFLIPVDDQELLEDRMNQLILDTNLQEKFASNASKQTDRFRADQVSEQWKKLILSVLK